MALGLPLWPLGMDISRRKTRHPNGCKNDKSGFRWNILKNGVEFLRAFWYFVEAKVLFELLGEELSDQGRELLKQYVILRKSLIKPFMSDEFEKNRFSSNLEENNKNKLNMYFDKWFFSNSKIVNRKCLMLSRMITNEME